MNRYETGTPDKETARNIQRLADEFPRPRRRCDAKHPAKPWSGKGTFVQKVSIEVEVFIHPGTGDFNEMTVEDLRIQVEKYVESRLAAAGIPANNLYAQRGPGGSTYNHPEGGDVPARRDQLVVDLDVLAQ